MSYHIDGELVPVLDIQLNPRVPVYFEHHVLLWKDPGVLISLKPMSGAFKRVLAGMPVFVTQATGQGHICFSRDHVGHVFPLHLRQGEVLDVREHRFLAASDNVGYTYEKIPGLANRIQSGSGWYIDKFFCQQGDGVLWLHGSGNVFEMTLGPGEVVDVEPGAWLYKDPTISLQTVSQGLKTGLLASTGNLYFNRFTGPGRLAIQSVHF